MTDFYDIKLNLFCHLNPQTAILKNHVVKKIGMECLTPFCREINGFSEELFSAGSKFKNGDTLLARITPCLENGKTAFVNILGGDEVAFGSTEFIILREKQGVSDALFLYYFAISSDFRKRAISLMSGTSGRQRVDAKILGEEVFSLPPLDVQKRIAGILGALDDRIDVLRRENVVLEQMAQAVFQSWFVDFDIVRAKAAGTPESEVCEKYHITPELYALFPSALTPDNLPLGWEKKKLGELVQNIKKSVKPSVETEHKPYVPIDCITAKTLTLYDFKDGKEAQSSLISFESRDILFGAMRAYFHKVCIAPFAGTTRSTVFCLRPKAPKDFSFALLSIFQNRCISYASQNSKGTTMPYAVWDNNLSEYQTEASTEDMRVAFNEYLGNSFDKMMLNAQQIRALSATRDALLPQLLGGKIEA